MQRMLIGIAAVLVLVGAVGAQQLALAVPLDNDRGRDWPMRQMEAPVRPALPRVAPEANRDADPGHRKPFQYDVAPAEDERAPDSDEPRPDVLDIRGA